MKIGGILCRNDLFMSERERKTTPLEVILVLILASLGWAIMILIYIYE
jgi:hypothetical protein